MLKKLNEINTKKKCEKTANAILILLILHLLFVFLIYYSTAFIYENPFIPKYLAFEIFAPYARKGVILTLGVLIATILKMFKQNLFLILVCVLSISIYYLTNFEPDFTDYKKLKSEYRTKAVK
nr:hypothetical protein [uncultured Flavobacterium sp.]